MALTAAHLNAGRSHSGGDKYIISLFPHLRTLSSLCTDSYFGIRSTPMLPQVERKRSRSFCQKCTWQVTAKHANTLRMWLCMKWYSTWLYGVHRTCAETAAVSYGTSHASAVSTPLWWIFKRRYKKLVTHVEYHVPAQWVCSRAENSAT